MRTITNKPLMLFIFSFLLLALVSVFCYYLYLMPLSADIKNNKTALQLAEQEVAILESKLKSSEETTKTNTVALQKQVPVKRLLEQALLEMEKAEIISGTNLIETKINGTESDESIQEELTTAEEAIKDANEEETNNGVQESEATEEVTLPNGIKKTSINIIGEANTYFELEKLLDKLQTSNRIMEIETIHITGTKEITSVEDEDQMIDFELTLSIYYYPELEALIDDLPVLESPETSNKNNPFAGVSIEEEDTP